MNSKIAIWMGLFIGSSIGSLIPAIWGSGILSFSSIIFSALGGLIGIWIGFKLSR